MGFSTSTFGVPLDLDLQLRRPLDLDLQLRRPLDLDLQLRRPLDLDLHRSEPGLVCSVLSRACGAIQGGWSLPGRRRWSERR
jgi:hypothetical protein